MELAVIAGIGAPIVALVSTILIYMRGRHIDEVTERTGITTEFRVGQAQINEWQQDLIALLQEDNRILRAEFAELKSQFKDLTKEVNRLYRKYGESSEGPYDSKRRS